jgi:sugar phosphate isomerase/epimerase
MSEGRINRRDALRHLAAAAALPALSGFREEEMSEIDRFGLAVYTVRAPASRDFERTLAAVAAIGYRDLDMYIYESRRAPSETRAILDRVGLTCTSARVATPAIYRGWDRSLDAAATLGARWITLANVPWEERTTWRDWQEMFEVFGRVGEQARRRGLNFCYHNHDFELQPIEGRIPIDAMLASTSADDLKLQMDVYWLTKGGREPVKEITRLGSRVASLHLKDMDRTAARGITTVGQGTLDFAAILRAARTVGVVDFFVEEDNPRDPMTAAGQAFSHLAGLRL